MLRWPMIRFFTKPAPAPRLAPVPVRPQPSPVKKPKGYLYIGKGVLVSKRTPGPSQFLFD